MATRFCGNCGTEVDEDAAFCPSCGRPIAGYEGDDRTEAIPAAPAWPEPARGADAEPPTPTAQDPEPMPPTAPPAAATPTGGTPADDPSTYEPPVPLNRAQEPPPGAAAGAPPPTGPPPAGAVPPGAAGERSTGPQVELPITWPVTLSGWLIGGGAFAAAVGFLADTFGIRGGGAVNILFLLLMLGVVATVFLSASMPAIPHLRLATLCVSFLALGVAVDRLGFSIAGFGTLLVLLGSAAAAAGAVILELGRDQPMAGPMDRH